MSTVRSLGAGIALAILLMGLVYAGVMQYTDVPLSFIFTGERQ